MLLQRAVPLLDRRGPDGGECTSVVAYHIDSGQITGRGGQRGVRPIGLGLIVLGLLMLAAPSAAAGG